MTYFIQEPASIIVFTVMSPLRMTVTGKALFMCVLVRVIIYAAMTSCRQHDPIDNRSFITCVLYYSG